jgi:hypothetical protein
MHEFRGKMHDIAYVPSTATDEGGFEDFGNGRELQNPTFAKAGKGGRRGLRFLLGKIFFFISSAASLR